MLMLVASKLMLGFSGYQSDQPFVCEPVYGHQWRLLQTAVECYLCPWPCEWQVVVQAGGGGGGGGEARDREGGEKWKGTETEKAGGLGGIVPVYCRPKYFFMYFLDLSAVPCKLQATRLCIWIWRGGGGGGTFYNRRHYKKSQFLKLPINKIPFVPPSRIHQPCHHGNAWACLVGCWVSQTTDLLPSMQVIVCVANKTKLCKKSCCSPHPPKIMLPSDHTSSKSYFKWSVDWLNTKVRLTCKCMYLSVYFLSQFQDQRIQSI